MCYLWCLCIAKWTSITKDFDSLKVEGIYHNWEASFYCQSFKERKVESWAPPSEGVLKFNVDGLVRRKSGPTGRRGAS